MRSLISWVRSADGKGAVCLLRTAGGTEAWEYLPAETIFRMFGIRI